MGLGGSSNGLKGRAGRMSGSRKGHIAPRVTVYTTPACHWCHVAVRYLDEHHIAHRQVDVTRDGRGMREMVLMTGGHAVPVIKVGEHAMVGWDVKEFRRLYERGRRRGD
jgi:glutaredoxin